MSQSLCVRCLRRSLHSPTETIPSSRAVFSTTSVSQAAPPKAAKTQKIGTTLRLSRNVRQVGRPPGVGERQAFKKRIVLSNTNALEVKGLKDFTAKELNGNGLEVGVRSFSDETVDALRALEAFQPRQPWGLFRRPATVVRKETIKLAEIMAKAKKPHSIVLDGERATGKSILLLQALAMAHVKGWIVIHFPDAKKLVNAHTSYAPIRVGDKTEYIQPEYTAKLLASIAQANEKILSKMQLSLEHKLPIPVQSNISLSRFAMLGAEDQDLAWPIFRALWAELTVPWDPSKEGPQRPPIMMGLDGLSHIMGVTEYLDVDANPIHAHDLTLVKTFVSALNMQSLPNGGVAIGATSGSDRPSSPTMEHYLYRQSPMRPYSVVDEDVKNALDRVETWRLEGIDKHEARELMHYWALSGILRDTVTDNLVHTQWSLAGGGVIGELERSAIRAPYFGV